MTSRSRVIRDQTDAGCAGSRPKANAHRRAALMALRFEGHKVPGLRVALPPRGAKMRAAAHWLKLSTARSRLSALVLCTAAVFAPLTAFSHAALIEAETAQAVRLHAFYDTGAPMSHAQVIIYAPDNPVTAWGQGVTDRDGRLDFVLGPETGRWSFQARQAGHGAMVHLDITDEAPVVIATSRAQSWGQRMVMVALVAWGALGTALFALSRRKGRDASA